MKQHAHLYQVLKALVIGFFCYGLVAPLTPLLQAQSVPAMSEIVAGMRVHDETQDQRLLQYEALRKFFAENKRFDMRSTLAVKTVFRRPGIVQSEILSSDGSAMIREKVFDKILDAEQEAQSAEVRDRTKITPDNYDFDLLAREDCDGRTCYRLKIVPKKKDKFSINGLIWLDAEDFAIIKIQGSPAKRPSFWTTHTEIVRQYKRIDGVWLCNSMESVSDIFIGGRSTLRIDYDYLSVNTLQSKGR